MAGNRETRGEVLSRLDGLPVVVAENVVPRIGVLAPEPARQAIRAVFLEHVIGGKQLSGRADFPAMVRGATPDLVLTGVEVLARVSAQDVAVVDVGGATTDVHSAVRLDPEEAAGLSREVVASTPLTRTVEGDLGMRWSATPPGRPASRQVWSPTSSAPPPYDARRSRRCWPRLPPSRRRTSRSPPPRRPWPCSGTSVVRAWSSVPTAGGSSAPARTCERWDCSWAREASCGTRPRKPSVASSAVSSEPRRRAGSCPSTPPWWWTVDYVLAAVGLLVERRPAAAAALARSLTLCEETPGELIGERRARSRARQESTTEQTKRENLELAGADRQPVGRGARQPAGDGGRSREIVGGPSNLAPARVPYGMDLAAAWAWRFVVICAAGSIVLWLLDLFLVVVLPGRDRPAPRRPGEPGRRAGCSGWACPARSRPSLIVVLGVLGIAAAGRVREQPGLRGDGGPVRPGRSTASTRSGTGCATDH